MNKDWFMHNLYVIKAVCKFVSLLLITMCVTIVFSQLSCSSADNSTKERERCPQIGTYVGSLYDDSGNKIVNVFEYQGDRIYVSTYDWFDISVTKK